MEQADATSGNPGSVLIGSSRQTNALRSLVERFARSDAPIIVTGPTGSGKDVVAKGVHHGSPRRDGPFVAVNCAAVPRELLESEFFGHERGAFTGAAGRREGLFERAAGGTLFLDEIGEMPLDLQAKLLRVLEDGHVRRLGGAAEIATDVRLVAATNRDLIEAIAAKTFRADLYYRLDVLRIEVLPLASRPDDIGDLIRHFANQFDPMGELTFTAAALELLTSHDWPGNVRQLRNFVYRASVLHPGERIDGATALALLGSAASRPAPAATLPVDLRGLLADTEIEIIGAALRSSDYVVSAAARALNMSRSTLIERIRKHRIEIREDCLTFVLQ